MWPRAPGAGRCAGAASIPVPYGFLRVPPFRLKCHNKCTKEAPPCHLLIIHRGGKGLSSASASRDAASR